MKIAVWSGPRNLSTALMYSFGTRNDFAISDEPFYAAYLNATGIQHPMQEEILANQEQDPNIIAENCIGTNPDNKNYWYQKHMCQHMIEGFPVEWAKKCKNVFLLMVCLVLPSKEQFISVFVISMDAGSIMITLFLWPWTPVNLTKHSKKSTSTNWPSAYWLTNKSFK